MLYLFAPFAPCTEETMDLPSLRFEHWRRDVPAGLVVFLVALPLCLGIALASEAPLFSGIIAGMIGGIVITLFSGSELSVSGPAAGLASIVAAAIVSLGSFKIFLAAVVIAGLLQLCIAAVRAGSLGSFIPHGVIKGMLAGIGITIILKQIPHAVGLDLTFTDEEQAFAGWDWLHIFTDPITAFTKNLVQPGAFIITVVSLAILLFWDTKFMKTRKWTNLVPGALVCVIVGALINDVFAIAIPHWELSNLRDHVVELPVAGSLTEFLNHFMSPEPSAFLRGDVWITGITIAIVASIESVLSVEAVDKMDPDRRISNTNKELVAQGLGNTLSGLIGGLPVTAVIVRSSANVYAGGRTRLSSFVHGVLLLLAVLFAPTILNQIPLACLAAILFVVGYKLSSLKLIRSMWKEGLLQFIPFFVTTVLVVATDLLFGVAFGLIVSMVIVLRSYHRRAITIVNDGDNWLMRFNKDMSFVNRASLRNALTEIPNNSHLIIDGTKALYIDRDIYETIEDFAASAEYRGMTMEYRNLFGKAL